MQPDFGTSKHTDTAIRKATGRFLRNLSAKQLNFQTRGFQRSPLSSSLFILIVAGLSLWVTLPTMTINAEQPIQINLEFQYLRQGTAGIIRLTSPEVTGGVASTLGRIYPFFRTSAGYASLLVVPMDTRIQDYPLSVTIYKKTGTVSWQGTLKVASGQFIAESDFNLPSDKLYLFRPDIQASEDARLKAVYSMITPERFWEGRFILPVDSASASPFGTVRALGNGLILRHTGLDLRAATGVPVQASANGRVVFARPVDIHGNMVIIDHGWGVFSAYAHLSEYYVVPGQFVLQGEVLGRSGNTGRSGGPHLHWEVAIEGIAVDPVAFLQLRLPM